MEHEVSSFETSEILANFLASTQLLSNSWRLSNLANSVPNRSFLMEQIGSIGYVAFPNTGVVSETDVYCGNLVGLDENTDHHHKLFTPLHRQINEGEDPIMVHEGFLNLFLSICGSNFQNQMLGLTQKCKSLVITGYSTRGTTASLSTLWLLSNLQKSISSSFSVLCITFGSPLLGNESLSRAILREKWDGSFCHVVSKYDIMPRLLFVPPVDLIPQLQFLQSHNDQAKAEIFRLVLAYLEVSNQAEEARLDRSTLFWPFGSYFFCSKEGAICMDNAISVIKMMHLTLMMGSPFSSVEDHCKYGDYIERISLQFLHQRNFMQADPTESCYEAGVALALESFGIAAEEPIARPARQCLEMARRMVRTPTLNVANLAIKLSMISPYRAQVEWYKACCDDADEQMGYYDSFKLRGASKRASQVNMNRIKLGMFWDGVITMFENNHFPHDFHKRGKWVNGSQSYKLLFEPLDIAEYYRCGEHRRKGHYIEYGRERRYKIFDRWWEAKKVEQKIKRSRLASLTQDTCFWAKLEEARECLDNARSERDKGKIDLLWKNINEFEKYAEKLVESKQVSKDVLLRNSSYVLWVEDLRKLRLQLMHFQ